MTLLPRANNLSLAVSKTEAQVTLLRQTLELVDLTNPKRFPRLVASLKAIEKSIRTDQPETVTSQAVHWAMNLTEVLVHQQIKSHSEAAYLATSRLAAMLFILSQLQEPTTKKVPTLLVELENASHEVAAQTLILEVVRGEQAPSTRPVVSQTLENLTTT